MSHGEDAPQGELMEAVWHERRAFAKSFNDEVAELLTGAEFQPGTASLNDHLQSGSGDLSEGIRCLMKVGDLQLFGAPVDAPDESTVGEDYAFFYEGKHMRPLTSLLPTITVTGNAETKPGGWKMLYEPEKSRFWAFLRMLAKMQCKANVGDEHASSRLAKIRSDLLVKLPVVIASWTLNDNLAGIDTWVQLVYVQYPQGVYLRLRGRTQGSEPE